MYKFQICRHRNPRNTHERTKGKQIMTTSHHSIKDALSDTALESFNMGLKVGKALTHERYQAALREVSVENELGACIYLADLQETLEMFYPDHDTPVS